MRQVNATAVAASYRTKPQPTRSEGRRHDDSYLKGLSCTPSSIAAEGEMNPDKAVAKRAEILGAALLPLSMTRLTKRPSALTFRNTPGAEAFVESNQD
jgi:hypothetical protein